MSTTTTTSTPAPTGATNAPAAGRPWQGSVQATLTRVNVDVVETIEFSDGHFTRRNRVVGGLSSQAIVELDDQARRALLAELQAELPSPAPGTDLVAIAVIIDLLEASLVAPPSHRFDTAHFGPVTYDEASGTTFGHLVLGVDLVGTVHDRNHILSFEQHPVVLPPGPYRDMSAADRASLANALRARPPADPGWQQVLGDADAPADT